MERVRTTVTLPSELLRRADELVQSGAAESRNSLMVKALERLVRAEESRAIDEAFAAMADDVEYQEEARRICREFADSDWEALRSAEADS